jgi:hypothetical protein
MLRGFLAQVPPHYPPLWGPPVTATLEAVLGLLPRLSAEMTSSRPPMSTWKVFSPLEMTQYGPE